MRKLSPFELTHARHFQHQVPSCSRKGTFARTIHCDLGFLPAIHISIINGHTGQRTIQIPAHKIRDGLAHSGRLHRRRILAYHLSFVNRHTRHRHRQASATNIGFELAHSHTFDRNRRFIDLSLGKNGGHPRQRKRLQRSGAHIHYDPLGHIVLSLGRQGSGVARKHEFTAPHPHGNRLSRHIFGFDPDRSGISVGFEYDLNHITHIQPEIRFVQHDFGICPKIHPSIFLFCVTHADPQRQAEQKQS